jgi:tRNA nucleotidyltransferase/poly(A) polymerase
LPTNANKPYTLRTHHFQKISTAAKNIAVKSYVIGGFVRDKILGRNLHKSFFILLVFKVKYL